MLLQQHDNKLVYSDGSEIEKELLEIAKKYPEDLSQDYISGNSCYTINNTFSGVRQNILNWYEFKENSNILEVGAGMGSITGLLCDKAKHVTVIEMNPRRAEVIKARYSARQNLSIISEDIMDWETTQKFDYIVFIGVLEYAGVFSNSKNPFRKFLGCIADLLKPTGITLFAIENRFGLKYWLGASEDHIQAPYVGVAGYKEKHTPQTFSKETLTDWLDTVGLSNKRFYYVYPDYKFPELICTDEHPPSYQSMQKVSFTYSKGSSLITNEKELYKEIIANKAWDFFANSFLVEASAQELTGKHAIYVSAKSEVKKEFRVSTVIQSNGYVEKIPVHPKAIDHINNIYKYTYELKARGINILDVEKTDGLLRSEFFDGKSAQSQFERYLENNNREDVFDMCDVLLENIMKSSEKSTSNIIINEGLGEVDNYGDVLKNGYIDMTFYNCFIKNDELIFYDQEWCFSDIPAKFILYYALKSAYNRLLVNTGVKLMEILERYDISDSIRMVYDKLENFLWLKILYRQTDLYGEDGYCVRYKNEITLKYIEDQANACMKEKEKQIQEKENQIQEKEKQIQEKENQIQEIENKTNEKNELLLNYEKLIENNIEEIANERNSNLSKIQALENILIELNQTIKNKEGHIQQLLDVEREYEREKQTRAYRIGLRLRRIKAFLLPVNSKRRFFARLIKRFILHPFSTFKLVSLKRIRKYFTLVKHEGMDGVNEHFAMMVQKEKIRNNPLAEMQIDILPINEVTDRRSIEEYAKLEFVLNNKPEVSIIIPAYNQFEYTYNCLQSILNNSKGVSYEIIIADDCSEDLTIKINEVVKGICVLRNKENLRFLKNCNNASKYAKGKYILFLNNDTQVQENWLGSLLSVVNNDKLVGLVGSKLVYANGFLQEAGGIMWSDASAWNYGNAMNPTDPDYNYVKEVDYISGAAVLIRKQLWEEIGGFDERFAPAYYEDADLAFEIRKRGYKVVYQPLSVVIHFEGISNGTDTNYGQKSYQVKNQIKFEEKWRTALERCHFANGENVFLARDRSRNKKHILVVDHYVPHYDKDAGGRCTYMYLKLFIKMGLQVTFIGDNFFKHEPYTAELNQMGINILYGNYYHDNWEQWLKENLHFFSYVYLQRPHISLKYIELIKENFNGKIFYFAHDLHHIRENREYILTNDASHLQEAEKWKEIEFKLFSLSDVGHVVGSYEQEIMQKNFPMKPIRNIPLYIYENIYINVNKKFNERKNILYVGGFGHPPNVDAVLWFAKEIFPKILNNIPDIKWHIVGGKATDEILKLANEHIVFEGFVTDEKLEQLYQTCKLAVVPLRVGAGVKGKVVEAAYYQMPLVTTSIGAEGLDDTIGNMVLEDNPEGMAGIIIELYNNEKKLNEMSQAGVAFIENYFTLEKARQVLELDL